MLQFQQNYANGITHWIQKQLRMSFMCVASLQKGKWQQSHILSTLPDVAATFLKRENTKTANRTDWRTGIERLFWREDRKNPSRGHPSSGIGAVLGHQWFLILIPIGLESWQFCNPWLASKQVSAAKRGWHNNGKEKCLLSQSLSWLLSLLTSYLRRAACIFRGHEKSSATDER